MSTVYIYDIILVRYSKCNSITYISIFYETMKKNINNLLRHDFTNNEYKKFVKRGNKTDTPYPVLYYFKDNALRNAMRQCFLLMQELFL